jgi:S-adenosylmethionine-diacylgycerolhomoserine-N-methlytransferase
MFANVATVWNMIKGAKGATHAQRLDSFYKQQAGNYDAFRERLLHGRGKLIDQLPVQSGCHIIEMGGGTGRNLEFFGARLEQAACVEVVDLCEPLLEVARQRIGARGWQNVYTVNADACSWQSQRGLADIVYFSYSLTMIPGWYAAIDNALRLLKPGGILGVVDFYVSRKYPALGRRKHNAFTRHFWPLWFGHDNVHPQPDLLPYLDHRLHTLQVDEGMGSIPYLPLVKVPHLVFTGLKRP